MSFTARDVSRFRAAVPAQVTTLPNDIIHMRRSHLVHRRPAHSAYEAPLHALTDRPHQLVEECPPLRLGTPRRGPRHVYVSVLAGRAQRTRGGGSDLQAMDMKMGRMAKMGEKWMWLELSGSEEEARVSVQG